MSLKEDIISMKSARSTAKSSGLSDEVAIIEEMLDMFIAENREKLFRTGSTTFWSSPEIITSKGGFKFTTSSTRVAAKVASDNELRLETEFVSDGWVKITLSIVC